MDNSQSAFIGIYTLTPLHMGTGQAGSAIDLPVARESHTGYPVIPATSLKGVARDICEQNGTEGNRITSLFGPDQERSEGGGQAGNLIFAEGQLLALPFRSLNLPLACCTSIQILERFSRNLRLFRCEDFFTIESLLRSLRQDIAYVADQSLEKRLLVIEDMAFQENEVRFSADFQAIAKELCTLLPADEDTTRSRFSNSLVLLPDIEFQSLVKRALPVQARIKLTSAKTTTAMKNSEGNEEKGNLWYEEYVCADSLFVSFVRKRPGGVGGGNPVSDFLRATSLDTKKCTVQMGGNETVGYGWCWWQAPTTPPVTSTDKGVR